MFKDLAERFKSALGKRRRARLMSRMAKNKAFIADLGSSDGTPLATTGWCLFLRAQGFRLDDRGEFLERRNALRFAKTFGRRSVLSRRLDWNALVTPESLADFARKNELSLFHDMIDDLSAATDRLTKRIR